MVKFLLLIAIFLFFNKSEATMNVPCKILKVFGVYSKIQPLIRWFYKSQKKDFNVKFLLGYAEGKDPIKSGSRNWITLFKNNFNVTKKTHLIIHGFLSHGKKSWVLDLKDAILRTVSVFLNFNNKNNV